MTTDLVGKTIGGYQLAEKIGSGRLATIYKAYQPIMERWVAVKVLPPQTKEALAKFQQETLEITHLRHRNIIISYDFGDQDGQPYIVTEYIEGGTLAEHLSGAPLDWIKAVDLLIPISEGLAYAHREGVMHGDIKPSNILLPKENWPLLTDFGLSKFVGSDGSTAPSVPVESAAYLAPERVKSAEYDQRSDIYSLGVVLFEMLTGRVPFSHNNLNDLLNAHATEPVPPIRQFNPSCPPVLELVIITAMNKAPEQRYANMEAMAAALKDALASSDVRPIFYKPAEPVSKIKAGGHTSLTLSPVAEKPASVSVVPPTTDNVQLFLLEKKISLPLPENDTMIIGRTHQNVVADVDLGPHGAADAGVSRRHARLIKRSEGWNLEDMGSLNGTFVNNVKLPPNTPTLLKNGDEIRCGNISFLFLLNS